MMQPSDWKDLLVLVCLFVGVCAAGWAVCRWARE